MSTFFQARWLHRGLTAVVLLAMCCSAAATARAGDIASLELIPADAAFYSAHLRIKEQIDIVAHSNAWARLKSMPAVMLAWQKLQDEMAREGGDQARALEAVKDAMELPENREAVELLGDMFSNETFVYGDSSAIGFAELFMQLNAARTDAMIEMIRNGALLGGGNHDEQRIQARAMLQAMMKNPELVKVPEVITGFKISDAKPAETQLKRLEVLTRIALKQMAAELKMPDLVQRLKRERIDGVEYLTFTVDGQMIPWEQFPISNFEDQPGEFAKVVERLKAQKISVALGVRKGFLLASFGSEGHAGLLSLGKGKLLADAAEMKPLKALTGKKMTSVGYASQKMMEKVSNNDRQLDQLKQMYEALLTIAPLDEPLKKRITTDMTALIADIKAILPTPSAASAFEFMTDSGYEGYSYTWKYSGELDASKPLDLLNHIGGKPLAMLVARDQSSPKQYQAVLKWVQVAWGYFEDYGVPQMEPKDKEEFTRWKEKMLPLIVRADHITTQSFLPALADGQTGLVLDAKTGSKQWLAAMPASDRPLMLIEPAMVIGVSDADLLKKSGRDYFAVAKEAIAAMRELQPGKVPPEVKLIDPQTKQSATGSIYYYPLPPEAGADPQLTPNIGVGKRVAVLSLTQSATTRILESTPFVGKGPLADTKRPLGAASYVDVAGLLEAVGPWIDYGVRKYGDNAVQAAGALQYLADDSGRPKLQIAVDDSEEVKFILDQVHAALDIMKTMKTVEIAVYLENGAAVSHTQVIFKDLPR